MPEKKYEYIAVSSLEGITQVEIKDLVPEKGVVAVLSGEKIVQYGFDMADIEAAWDFETMIGFINKRGKETEILDNVLQCVFLEQISQAYTGEKLKAMLPPELIGKLAQIDQEIEKGLGVLSIKYGKGSNKQVFGRDFFQSAGAKFEGKPFLYNHSDSPGEFGKAIPMGFIPKYLGDFDDGAHYMYYVSPSEGTMRAKIKESVILGDYGYLSRVSLEGFGIRDNYVVKDGLKIFHDVAHPSGIALVKSEGMKGSKIIA